MLRFAIFRPAVLTSNSLERTFDRVGHNSLDGSEAAETYVLLTGHVLTFVAEKAVSTQAGKQAFQEQSIKREEPSGITRSDPS